MLDIQFIRDNHKEVQKKSGQKGFDVDIDNLLKLDTERKKLLRQVEELRAKRNHVAEKIKQAGKPDKKLVDEGKQAKVQLAEREKYFDETDKQWLDLLKSVPNMPLDEVPVGKDENDNKVMAAAGDKPKFDFEPKSHVQLGEAKGWIDKQRAAKVAGTRFVYLKGDLVRLEMALMQYGVDRLGDEKFIKMVAKDNKLGISTKPFEPILPPAMARTKAYDATARLDKEETTYKLADDDLWLNASAEHTLAPMFSNETIDESHLPLRYIGHTTAFRREAGSYGKDTEGILRLHQFNKLEMESFTKPKDGVSEHILMTMLQRKLMEELEIPYQLIQKCTADIGGPNASGWDINCWMPGQGAYRETHTADYMGDYQARRMKTKYKSKDGKTGLVHTNDATVFAQRQLIAIVENYQTKDGGVKVPKVLQKYMGGKKTI
jgi:seryl-tRNA synthetase